MFKRNLGLRTNQIRVAGEKLGTLRKAKSRGNYRERNLQLFRAPSAFQYYLGKHSVM